MWDNVFVQVLGLASALVVAYFTGATRRYGHRMERLYTLADKLPEGSPVRDRFEAAAYAEAQRVAERTLKVPPRVLLAQRFLLVFSFLVLVLLLIGNTEFANRIAFNLGAYFEAARGGIPPGEETVDLIITIRAASWLLLMMVPSQARCSLLRTT